MPASSDPQTSVSSVIWPRGELDVLLPESAEIAHAQSEFASIIAHELRTPLNNMMLYLDLLETGRPERHPHYVQTLKREAAVLQSLIDDLLQLTRLELGKVVPDLVPVNVREILTALAESFDAQCQQQGLTLECLADPTLPAVQADPRLMQRALGNLLDNALKYTGHGGTVRLQVELRNGGPVRRLARDLEPTSPAPQAWMAFAVSDTGLGLTPDDQAQLFRRFYRGSAAQATHAPGTGLGLAMSLEIVKRHGGYIEVASRPGEGSVFTVWLPAQAARSTQ